MFFLGFLIGGACGVVLMAIVACGTCKTRYDESDVEDFQQGVDEN